MPQKILFKVTGDAKIIKAFRTLGDKVSKGVVKPAAKRAAAKFQVAIRERAPVRTGMLRRKVAVKTARGPKAFQGRSVIAFAVIAGQAKPTKAQKAKGTRIPFYAFMQEKGYHLGKRIRQGKKVIGYQPHAGKSEVKYMPGKHFVKRALKTVEGPAREAMLQEIYDGIDALAGRG